MKTSWTLSRRAGIAVVVAILLALGPVYRVAVTRAESLAFTATFRETVTSFDCPHGGPICTVTAIGLGHATPLGATIESLVGTVDTSTSPCATLQDTRTLTAANGDQLFVRGIGQNCALPPNNPRQSVGTLTWTITGGTGTLAGDSGSGTERLEPGHQPFILAHYIGTLVQ